MEGCGLDALVGLKPVETPGLKGPFYFKVYVLGLVFRGPCQFLSQTCS